MTLEVAMVVLFRDIKGYYLHCLGLLLFLLTGAEGGATPTLEEESGSQRQRPPPSSSLHHLLKQWSACICPQTTTIPCKGSICDWGSGIERQLDRYISVLGLKLHFCASHPKNRSNNF